MIQTIKIIKIELVKSSCTYFVEPHVISGEFYENMLSVTNFQVVILNKFYYIKLDVIQ